MKRLIFLFVVMFSLSTSLMKAQTIITEVSPELGQHFANTDDFNVGKLSIRMTLPSGVNTANVTVTLPHGIEYIPSTITDLEGATVAYQVGSPLTKPVFVVTATTAGTSVRFSIKRKITKTTFTTALIQGQILKDKVEVVANGVTDVKESAEYNPIPFPVLTIQFNPTSDNVHNNASGTSVKKIRVRNTGTGSVKKMYLSVKYPIGVSGAPESVIASLEGSNIVATITEVGNVPAGFGNAGLKIYEITTTNPNGFKTNDYAEITEKYSVTGCQQSRNIVYEAYFGEDLNNLYAFSNGSRAINVTPGTPNIQIVNNDTKTYFTWRDGICGNIVGDITATMSNDGSGNATAYDLDIEIANYPFWHSFLYYIPQNLRIVTPAGVEISIPTGTATATATARWRIPLEDLPELTTSVATADIGLTDVDGDGFKDDLAKGASFTIRYELKKVKNYGCLMKDPHRIYAISPRIGFHYKDACGENKNTPSELYGLSGHTFNRYIASISDGSKFPPELPQGQAKPAYIIFGKSAIGSFERLKNGSGGTYFSNYQNRYYYEIKLPAGVEMLNVRYVEGYAYGVETQVVSLPNVPAGGTFTYTTTSADRPFKEGYVAFDVKLTTPCVNGTDLKVQYKINLLEKNPGTDPNSFCEIPLVCGEQSIRPICPATACTEGPELKSIKTERSENSLGWTDHTMTTRATKDFVGALQLQRSLYLDEIEVISEVLQKGSTANNLYHHFLTTEQAKLKPKKVTLTVGTYSKTLDANDIGVVTTGTYNPGNNQFHRWNLTSALPSGGITSGQAFTVVVTYQVESGKTEGSAVSGRSYYDRQSAGEAFFYVLQNSSDTNMASLGHHTNAKYCGAKQIPTFYIADTYVTESTNRYNIESCQDRPLGGDIAYTARRFGPSGTPFKDFRPGRLLKKMIIKLPSAYRITKPLEYRLRRSASDIIIHDSSNPITIPLSSFNITDNGVDKIYTFVNPAPGAAGHLPPGEISIENHYSEQIRAFIQASCGAVEGNSQIAKIDFEYEDYYYHYAANSGSEVSLRPGENRQIYYSKKPNITFQTRTQLNTVANKKKQFVEVTIHNTSNGDARYSWLAIPDVTGINVLNVTEINEAGSFVRTETYQTSVTGQKMYHLTTDGTGNIPVNQKRHYRIDYEINNCQMTTLSFGVYAGWNCASYPIGGYKDTCHEKKLTYNIQIAKSLIQVEPNANNPGQSDPNQIGSIPMCEKTEYKYVINSGEKGDIFDPKVVIVQRQGITISDVTIEYPLGSGIMYSTTSTPAIIETISGNKRIYDLSNILPNNVLPGSITQPSEGNKRKLEVKFNIKPDCDFRIGSSFDVDMEGNNLCNLPAEGDKTTAIIAGIAGVDTNKYTVNNTLVSKGGNANLCATEYALFEGEHKILVTGGGASFQTGNNGRVVVVIPQGFEYVENSFQATHRSNNYFQLPQLASPATAQDGDNTELYIQIPQGMKDQDLFRYTVRIKQKENTLAADCQAPKKLKYFTIDKVTGIICPSGPISPCPDVDIVTTVQRGEVQIPIDRAQLNIRDVKLSSVLANNKERVTISYVVENLSTSMNYSGDLKIGLYHDTNNNLIIEEGIDEKIEDITISSLNLSAGASSNQAHIVELTQSKLCRLFLSIRNSDNHCLCSDVAIKAEAPNELTDLIQPLTVCEIGEKTFVYNTQAPEYVSYKWTAVTPGANAYLSDLNVKTPVFKYTGVDITSVQTITYLFNVQRTDGCEATQTVTVELRPSPNAPMIAPQQFCSPVTVYELKARINSVNTDLVKVYSGNVLLNDTETLYTTQYHVSYVDILGCETEKTVVDVTVQVCNIDAKDDVYKASAPVLTPITVGNVLTNDKLGTVTATITNVDLTIVTDAGTGAVPTLNTTTGEVQVPVNTPEGTYYIEYKICAKGSTVDCDTAKVTVVVTPKLDARDDDLGTFDGVSGGTTTQNVFTNDVKGTVSTPVDASEVNLSWGASPIAGIVPKPEGTITIQPNTPAGTYTISYTICEKINPLNCDTATVTVKVVTIEAVDDTPVTLPKIGGNIPVLPNDEVGTPNGVVSATIANVTPSIVNDGGLTGVSFNTDGTINVPPTAPSGTYVVEYRICTIQAPVLCDNAKVTITKQPEITAVNDNFALGYSTAIQTAGNVLNNPDGADSLNGNLATPQNVVVTQTSTPTGSIVPHLQSNGNVVVPPRTPMGIYTFTYSICEKDLFGNPTSNCDDAEVTVTIHNINADNDDFEVSAGGNTGSVLNNDKYDGEFLSSTVSITLTPIGTLPSGISLDPITGIVRVASGTPSGNYSFNYEICSKVVHSLCDDATVTIRVKNSIIADDDDLGPVVSGGTTTQTVISNDKLNGTPVVIGTGTGEVTLTPLITPTGITIDATNGKVSVGNNVPSGVYTLTYKICENGATPDNCDDATVTITVQNGIVAEDDDLGTVVSGGTTTQTVISNDKLNGTPVVIGTGVGQVTLTPLITPTGITIDATNGKVTVGTNVSSGVYTLTYKICENGATPDNCDDATVTVTVQNGIVAEDDDLGPVVSGGTTTQTVISNDKLNGTPVVIGVGTGEVTLTPLITPTGITIDGDGKVTVGTNVSSGVYTLTYKICENGATPDNCDDATVTITVENSIVADNDNLGLVVSGGTTTQTVISNDKLNGTSVVIGTGVGQVTLTPIITPTGITIDATNGKVSVGNNVPSGVYTLTYKICENGATPDNCDDATVTVTVQNGIVAEDDDLGPVVSGDTTTQTVISNDKLNGTPVVIGTGVGQVTLTPIITPTGITIDTTNGKVSVANNVPSGEYTLTYTICENGSNPLNCDDATVTITVLSSNTVLAISDINNTYLNTSVSGNVSTNDEDPQGDALEFSLLTASNHQGHSLVFNSDGTYVFTPKEGFTGVVVYEYEVCDKGMPRACATATLTIGVLAQPKDGANTVFANDDAVRTKVGTPVLISVLANDIDVEGDTFEITSHPSHTSYGSLSLSNGKLTYTPNAGYVGVDSFTYTICDNRTTDKACSTATVRVLILSDTSSNTTFANDDAYNGDKNRVISGNVLSNDVDLEGNGQTTTLLSGATKGVVMLNADGTFSYKPNMGYVGPDSFTYKLCDDGTPEACAVATVYLTVNEAESIVANNDDFTNTPIRNMVGGVLGSVLTNDTYLGVPISSGQVSGVTLVSDGGLTGVTLDGSGHLTIPQGATEGTYTLTYEVCEKSKGSCATAEIYVRIIKGCPLNFYNGLSNNEDGTNDGFVIDGIECYPKNKVRIYNRWGVKVFETEGYNNKERLFRGISNGRVTVDADKKLPQGTYYYVLEYTDGSNQTHSEAGWLYIKR
ncbi:Ig-like domain-containing protein [Capnocytophaga canimorsus]|uniref:Ig-like domain-containing protein n=2 Tax=Capnocytophaga canimorsus TaxID=28188 RepID=UPI001EDD440E|nr:Ig-like domain-containing protein [Capnocytophaga canimorsus]